MKPSADDSSRARNPLPQITSTVGLAQYLGLSEWTVSRAINGHPEVKKATRDRITAAMNELGFRPNPVARRLSGKGMGIIGVCFGNAQHTVVIDKITMLDAFLRDNDLRAILSISPKDEEGELRILEDFRHLRVDGIVLVQSYLNPAQLEPVLRGVPCVHVDPSDPKLTPNVWLDRCKAMQLELNHLFELGHRSFGVVGFSPSNTWRWNGVVAAFEERGMNLEKHVEIFQLESPGSESYGEGIELGRMVLAAKKRPTALLAVNDRVAEGLMQAMEDADLQVPRDISVVGFDNLSMGRHLKPTLTTIDQQNAQLIAAAGQLLLGQFGKNPKARGKKSITIDPVMIVRESSGPPPR